MKVKADGRRGKIEETHDNGNLVVKLDSGHMITANHTELEPENFSNADPGAESGGGLVLERAILAIDSGKVPEKLARATLAQIRKYQTGETIVDPLGGGAVDALHEIPVDPRLGDLPLLLKMCADCAEPLEKRRKPRTDLKRGLKVKVRNPVDGTLSTIGEITSIDGVIVKVAFPGGEMVALDHAIELAAA